MQTGQYGAAPQPQPGFGGGTPADPAFGPNTANTQYTPPDTMPTGGNGGQWQGADPSQAKAMTPEQQAAFHGRTETEQSKSHEEIIEKIRRGER